ncbi:hypothetical protein [Azotosporobacter soli]|uniref:hypothetical protein n=1 Tax=Azotosporobacter soli TaxID=3055040 RepID=UPI0031FEFAC0
MHQQRERIAALIPCYGPAGDTTITITGTGEVRTQRSALRTVLQRLLREKSIDIKALRKKTAPPGRRPVLQPLPLADGLLLCPLKLRLPKVPGDTCTGYVNVHLVESVSSLKQPPYQSQLHLRCGQRVPVVWSAATVNRHLHNARLCQQRSYLRESDAPDLLPMAHKLAELIYELLLYRPPLSKEPLL